MPRYIDAEKIRYFWHQKADGGLSEGITIQSMINEVPTADVEEVKHGYWEQMKSYKSLYVCSRCGDLFPDYKSDYCPSCGAKMDGIAKINHDSLCETETYIHNHVEEVKHGKWLEATEWEFDEYSQSDNQKRCYKCSRCGRIERHKEPYCHCGAKMA